MTDCYKPRDECGLSSAIKDAATAKMPLVVRGAGSKSAMGRPLGGYATVSYTHLRAHETVLDLVCRLLLEKKNTSHHMSESAGLSTKVIP